MDRLVLALAKLLEPFHKLLKNNVQFRWLKVIESFLERRTQLTFDQDSVCQGLSLTLYLLALTSLLMLYWCVRGNQVSHILVEQVTSS